MMNITDLFIRRPVLATVVSALIVLVGLGSFFGLSLRQYPKMKNTVITITTTFSGADAAIMQGFITEPIQQAIATVGGIDTITSSSEQGVSSVKATLQLNADANAAMTDITGKVSGVQRVLPAGSDAPVIGKSTGSTFPELILAFTSQNMRAEEVTAYIRKVVTPQLANVAGVAKVDVWGGEDYAMRVWLNPHKMAALKVTPSDVMQALQASNVQAQAGEVESAYKVMPIQGGTTLHTVADFKRMVVRDQGGHLVTLGDIAKIELGARSHQRMVLFDGHPAYFAAVALMPEANPLSVIHHVFQVLPSIRATLPAGLAMHPTYDSTEYIASALHEVVETLLIATVIVMVVVFFCLGSWRAVLIPVSAIPLSLLGVCFFMKLMGFSLNLLTFLAMVLAIGMVVDDAIVVVENIDRHMEQGDAPQEAALKGAREIALPIVVMTLTLAAVFAPIGFVSGITGALFREFAFTLAGAVIISGIVALTLSPMLCSKWLNRGSMRNPWVHGIDRFFHLLQTQYGRFLHWVMGMRSVWVTAACLIMFNAGIFYVLTPKALAPAEDQGFLGVVAQGPKSANLAYLKQYNTPLGNIFKQFPAVKTVFMVDGVPTRSQIFSGMILKPWGQRKQTPADIQTILQQQVSQLPGVRAFVFVPPPLPGDNQNLPVNVVLKSTLPFDKIDAAMKKLEAAAKQSGLFTFMMSDLSFNHSQWALRIDREKAGDLGITMQSIATALKIMVGDQNVTRFSMYGDNFEVVPQLDPDYRSDTHALGGIYVRSDSGEMVPLFAVVSYQTINEPSALKQFQQLNAATLPAALRPGVSLGQALAYLQAQVSQHFSNDFQLDYDGASRQYMQEGHALMWVAVFSLLLIFLLLAAQYESFRDPLIVLFSVPMSLFGAMLPLVLGLAAVNIYTQIGMITLAGLISKHGILMVSRANALRLEEGMTRDTAIVKAAQQRLRPILMTTAAMVFGVLPLLLATGAGAVSRFDLGLVIGSGMLIGTCFTLWVVPVFYSLLAHR